MGPRPDQQFRILVGLRLALSQVTLYQNNSDRNFDFCETNRIAAAFSRKV